LAPPLNPSIPKRNNYSSRNSTAVESPDVIDDKQQQQQQQQQTGKKSTREKEVLNPRQWTTIVLSRKEQLTRDIRLFTFELEGDQSGKPLGLPTGQHVLLSAHSDDKDHVVRPYTPIHPSHPGEDDGRLVFLIKIYKLGKMTQLLDQLKIGAKLQVKGPSGPIMYLGENKFLAHGNFVRANFLSMIAGGTGITPIFQMTKAILESESGEDIQLSLLTANNTPADIPLRQELQELVEKYPKRLRVWHTVSQLSSDPPPSSSSSSSSKSEKNDQQKENKDEGEEKSKSGHEEKGKAEDKKGEGSKEDKGKTERKYTVGHIDARLMREHLFVPSENEECLALVCGPPAMVAHTCFPALEELGYTEDNLFEF